MTEASYRKKLIEVSLPLDDINRESAREKSIRQGHPSTLHLWWARRPLAACRAVLFGQLVDDPSSVPGEYPTPELQDRKREELFALVRDLVVWENAQDEAILYRARLEIARSVSRDSKEAKAAFREDFTREDLVGYLARYGPGVHDPFAGGGSIPLEAQRLGLRAFASDLNPVPVLINRAMIEFPPKFRHVSPVNPASGGQKKIQDTSGNGLATDVEFYGTWIEEEARRRIGKYYPNVSLTPSEGGGEATPIAYLWARTVKCPNPACGVRAPLLNSFVLSSKEDKETYLAVAFDGEAPIFEIRNGAPGAGSGTRAGKKATFGCVRCNTTLTAAYLRAEGKAGRMTAVPTAIVCKAKRGVVFVPASRTTIPATPAVDGPTEPLATSARHMSPVAYGFTEFRHMFTARQLLALTTFSTLVREAEVLVRTQAEKSGMDAPAAADYAHAVATYLTLAVGRSADYWSAFCGWADGFIRSTFGRGALQIIWDFAEANPFSGATGSWENACSWVYKAIPNTRGGVLGHVAMQPAQTADLHGKVLATDPPYYDNVPYSDLADFFYVWHKRCLAEPKIHSTLVTPKDEELVADPDRHGSEEAANDFFERGMFRALSRMTSQTAYPATIFYAFKQQESSEGGQFSSGWDSFLQGLLDGGVAITATMPVRSERPGRARANESNALASSIVLVCRPRPAKAEVTTRQDFVRTLKRELPQAIRYLQAANVQPVDLAQAAIGPGMAVFSRYAKVLEPTGEAMRVRGALQLINSVIGEVESELESDYDRDTRWALAWFSQHAHGDGVFGDAETLARAKATSVDGLQRAGIVAAKAGKVRLLARSELGPEYSPAADERPTLWEAAQHLVRALETSGEEGAAALHARLGGVADEAKALCYSLYQTSERQGWTKEAQAYNALIASWSEIERLARAKKPQTLEAF